MTRPVLRPVPAYVTVPQVGDLVKVVEAENAGRWGVVAAVHDFTDHPDDAPADVDALCLVDVHLKTLRGRAMINSPADPIPFAPYELAALFDAAGDFVRRGRVVSRRNWMTPRTGLSETS